MSEEAFLYSKTSSITQAMAKKPAERNEAEDIPLNNTQDYGKRRTTTKWSKEVTWVKENFKKKTCNSFVPDPGEKVSELCVCGKKESDHDGPRAPKGKKWSPVIENTDAYGEIDFALWNPVPAKFLRLQDDVSVVDHLVELMLGKWHLPPPKLIISVTGGALNFTLEKGLKQEFRRGLIKAAVTTGAWIVTGGTQSGVMRHVGKAVQEYLSAHGHQPLVVLGVAPWGCVYERHKLQIISKQPVHFMSPRAPPELEQLECPLDPNHTHFVLVDDGTVHKYGSDTLLRARLEAKLAELGGTEKVPVVCISLEGGPGTIHAIKSSLEEGTPVVLLKGSGRMTDVLAEACRLKKQNNLEELELLLNEKLSNNSSAHMKQSIQLKQCMEYCLENMDLLLYYSHGDSSSLDQAIVQCILKSKRFSKDVDKLHLALQWERADLAAKFINLRSEISTKEYERIFLRALLKNQRSIIEKILHTGVISMKSFVNAELLNELYRLDLEDSHSDRKTPLQRGLCELVKCAKSEEKLKSVGKFLDMLLGRPDSNPYTVDQREEDEKISEFFTDDLPEFMPERPVKSQVNKTGSQTPYVHLFLWCVLANKFEIAMLFWDRCVEQMALALAAQRLCKALLKFASNSEEENFLQENARFYGDLAVDFLTHLYRDDSRRCQILILTKTQAFGGVTALKLALLAKNLKFVAHYACQSVLESIWNGTIRPEASSFQVFMTLLIPCYASKTTQFTSHENDLGATLQKEMYLLRSLSRNSTNTSENASKSHHCGCLEIYQAPQAKFLLSCLSHMLFLCLLSLSLTCYFDRKFVVLDWVLIGWVSTLVLEEIRQVIEVKSVCNYLRNIWNLIEVLSIVTYTAALLLRLPDCRQCLVWARIVGSVSNIGFFMAALNFLTVSRRLGPKILMIGQMMIDLLAYVVVLLIFIICFGVMIQAVLHPGRQPSLALVRDVLRMPYFQIYGELFLDAFEECEQESGNITKRCQNETARAVLPIFLGVYVLITNVLVLNLIIAMFSFTVTKIHENTDEIWRKQRYSLVRSYCTRPVLPPPLVVVEHFVRAIHYCGTKCGICRIDLPPSERKALQAWESLNAYEFMRTRKQS